MLSLIASFNDYVKNLINFITLYTKIAMAASGMREAPHQIKMNCSEAEIGAKFEMNSSKRMDYGYTSYTSFVQMQMFIANKVLACA